MLTFHTFIYRAPMLPMSKKDDLVPADTIAYTSAGPYKTVYGADQYVLRIAIMCHEANRDWCMLQGDSSQRPWNDATDHARESAVDGVIFHLRNPDAGDAASHDNWMRGKLAAGWRYGLKKDEVAKTHPCLVPFTRLSWDQQAKDRLFRHVVLALSAYTPLGTT